jgi:hypothetical protein
MTFSLDFPAGPMAEAVLSVVRSSESPSVANHSVRSFLFAQVLAAHEGCLDDTAYDRHLLFAATVTHGANRFEVEGADLAAAVLREHGVPDRDVDRVWEAIALHTSPGIAERRGLLAYLTREGVGIDFGRRTEVVMRWEKEIHAAYPRLAMARSLIDEIVKRAAQTEAAAPRYSFPAGLLRERRADGITSLERAVTASVWGE